MIKNFDTELKDLDGKVIIENQAPIPMKKIVVNALLATYPDEPNLNGEEKLARFSLAERVNKGGDVEFSTEDLSKLKTLVGKFHGPLVAGQIIRHIEA